MGDIMQWLEFLSFSQASGVGQPYGIQTSCQCLSKKLRLPCISLVTSSFQSEPIALRSL